MLRFYIALWVSKLYLFFQKLTKNEKSDRIGILARKICPNVLEIINKPKVVIMVTGTNGKSTISNLIYDSLKLDNKKIGFNIWNANMIAGNIRCLIDCVNVFNRPNKDIAILECDELTTDYSIKAIKPTYVVISNVCRDSIRRNAYPEYIFNKINSGCNDSKDSILILNADDPISSFVGKNNKNRKFIAIEDQKIDVYDNITKDFSYCQKCFEIPIYDYKIYRHIGKFHCNNCGLTSFKPTYIAKDIDFKNKSFKIDNEDYKLLSETLFNIYNEMFLIALLKQMGYNYSFISSILKKIQIPKSRENLETIKGINVYLKMSKGQNSSAASTVFENLIKDKKHKQLILVMDEAFELKTAMESISWLYDTDFELLNNKYIDKIVVTGHICKDYVARLKLCGISQDKIVVSENYLESAKCVDLNKNSDIYILYEVEQRPTAQNIFEKIKEIISRGSIDENN